MDDTANTTGTVDTGAPSSTADTGDELSQLQQRVEFLEAEKQKIVGQRDNTKQKLRDLERSANEALATQAKQLEQDGQLKEAYDLQRTQLDGAMQKATRVDELEAAFADMASHLKQGVSEDDLARVERMAPTDQLYWLQRLNKPTQEAAPPPPPGPGAPPSGKELSFDEVASLPVGQLRAAIKAMDRDTRKSFDLHMRKRQRG